MGTFYEEMAGVAQGLLAPESEGGFGQGTIRLVRTIAGTPDPAEPWVPVDDTVQTYRLDAVAKSVSNKLVDGTTILATDTEITAAATMELESVLVGGVPDAGATLGDTQIEIEPGDGVTIDGEAVAVLRVMRVPRAGTVVAWKLIVRS